MRFLYHIILEESKTTQVCSWCQCLPTNLATLDGYWHSQEGHMFGQIWFTRENRLKCLFECTISGMLKMLPQHSRKVYSADPLLFTADCLGWEGGVGGSNPELWQTGCNDVVFELHKSIITTMSVSRPEARVFYFCRLIFSSVVRYLVMLKANCPNIYSLKKFYSKPFFILCALYHTEMIALE